MNYDNSAAVMIASFVYCGFLEIGDQIEQPLGYDACDLDMGMFASNIAKELRELSSMPAGDPGDFFFSTLNEPLAPADTRSAWELAEDKVGVHEIQEKLKMGHASAAGSNLNRSFTQIHRASSIGGGRPPASNFELASVSKIFKQKSGSDLV